MEEARMTHAGVRAHSAEGSGGRITQAGLVARSAEGTAAKGMPIKGHEDLWVEIQANTFRNWINEHLRRVNMRVVDLVEDLSDGTALCALVEALQGRRLRGWSARPTNQHHRLENVATALAAIEEDGVKLVNIGNVDIVNGNLKLILGLIWSLIVRYQIGRSKFPPRKLMLAWLQAALPECKVNNLTTDWNSGVTLSALLDYCKPGLFPHWRDLNPQEAIDNCSRAMRLAQHEFDIPQVLEPEYLASPWLDELSGMTYLSYFMKPGSPGFQATLEWVNSKMEKAISNFTTDWNDGRVACELVRVMGGSAPPAHRLRTEQSRWESNLQQAIDAGKKMGIHPILSAKDMANRDVEHLGVMAYATNYRWVPPKPPIAEQLRVALESTSGRVGEPTHMRVDVMSDEIPLSAVRTSVVTPLEQEQAVSLNSQGDGTFVPEHAGMHEIVLTVDDTRIDGRFFFRVMPRLATAAPPGMAPCAVGSIVEVLVNATGAPRREDIDVTAYAPSGRKIPLKSRHPPTASPGNTASSATFEPDEPGTWTIAITYQGKHIQGGPFTCDVFDPAGVRLSEGALEGAQPLRPHSFELDTSGCGPRGDLQLDIVHDKRSVMCALERLSDTRYRATFMPKAHGKHRLYVYFNGYDVKGSPFIMRVGSKSKSRRRESSSPQHVRESPARVISPVGKYRSESPYNNGTNQYEYNKSKNTSLYESRIKESGDIYNTSSYGNDQLQDRSSADRHNSSYYDRGRDVVDSTYSSTKVNKKHEIYNSNRYGSESPKNTSFTPITNKYLGESRSDMHRGSSPYRTTSPIGRTASPLTKPDNSLIRTASPVNRVSSPSGRFSPAATTRKVVEKSNYRMYSSYSNSQDNLDESSPLPPADLDRSFRLGSPNAVGPPPTEPGGRVLHGRRDSWDAIQKTRHVLSPNSLESLANLADKQLDDGWSRSVIDSETRRNTQRNKFAEFSEDSFNKHLDKMVDYPGDNYGQHEYSTKKETSKRTQQSTSSYIVRDSSYSSVEEKQQQHQQSFLSNRPPRDMIAGGAHTSSSKELANSHSEIDATHNRFRSVEKQQTSTRSKGARGVIIKPTHEGLVGKPVEFIVDGSEAGSGDLEIVVEGGGALVASSVRPLAPQRFLAAFTPRVARQHVVSVTFNGEPVPGSPWTVRVMSVSAGSSASGSVVGEATRLIAARAPAVFEVSAAPGSGAFTKSEVGVNVTAPSRRAVAARVQDVPGRAGVYRIEFTPEEVGTHLIDVSIGGDKLLAGPLVAKVYDASLIRVTDVANAVVGQQCQFRVDASSAGEGQLEISINEGEVPNHVQVVGGGRCLVFWRPETARPHRVDIKFNGEAVPSSPFVFHVSPAQRVTIDTSQIELIPVNQPAQTLVRVAGSPETGELAVSVRGPRGELPVRLAGDAAAGLSAEFTPRAVGPHTLVAHYNGVAVQGTPFVCKAYDARLVSVNGGTTGRVGLATQLGVDASQAGEGNLEITVSARGLNIPTQVHPQGNARFTVSFTPTEACDHVVNVSFNKMRVPGCPLTVSVTGTSGEASSSGGSTAARVTLPGPAPLHRPATLLLHHDTALLDDIEVNVEGPNGASVPATVAAGAAGTFQAEFVPRAVGEHRVSVVLHGTPMPASPFHVKVYDVTAIRVKDVSNGTVGKPVTFLVETMAAGPGNLEVTVNGGRVPTAAAAQGAHTYAISFTPREPRPHTVELRFNGDHVPGSPFVCHISAPARVVGAGTGESPDKVSVGETFTFNVESPTSPHVEVLGPARRPVPVQVATDTSIELDDETSKRYIIQFVPVDVGDHSIEVKSSGGGSHVEGSPFLIKAYSAERVSVTDISPGVVGRPVSFTINASHAGAGNLEIIVAVNGRNVPNYVQSEGNARFKVNFKPVEAAPHNLSVRFNSEAVPGSPFTCLVSSGATSTASEARASGDALASTPRGLMAEIPLTGFHSTEPTTSIIGPGGGTVRCKTTALGGGRYTLQFSPEQVGRHLLHVLAGTRHVPGSPFSCNVYDVDRVRVTGLGAADLEGSLEGLTLGEGSEENITITSGGEEVGKPVTFSVDAASAGEGTLELVVSTPTTTVKAEVVAVARGLYDVTFIPISREPHRVSVTFNERPVPGSPFVCRVAEPHTYVHVGGTAVLELPGELTSSDELEVLGPTGRIPVRLGAGRAVFTVTRTGRYTVRGPRGLLAEVEAFDTETVKVVSVGDAYCHRPAIVTVSTSGAGAGRLSARVRCGGSDVPHSVRVRGAGRHELVYHPARAAPHRIMLLWCGVPVQATPLVVDVLPPAHGQEVTSSGLGLYQAHVGHVSSFSIDTLGRPAREFDVVVSAPGARALPVRCYQTKSGLLQAEYTVPEVGQSTIEVLHMSKSVSGSPFTCESFDPSKVLLTGLPTGNVVAHTPVNFTVDHSAAGVAELEVQCSGVGDSSGERLAVEVRPERDTTRVRVLPTVPGHYRLYISYGGVNISDSPVSLGVLSGTGPSAAARPSGTGLSSAHVGKEAAFTINCSEDEAPHVEVDRINSLEEVKEGDTPLLECSVTAAGPCEWRCAYIPLAVGLYEVRVSGAHSGPMPGSPFQVKVIDTSAVVPVGGWAALTDSTGRVRGPSKLVLDTTAAGPGQLECLLAGRHCPVETVSGRAVVTLGERTPGEHELELTYNGAAVPAAPRRALLLAPAAPHADRVTLAGRGLAHAVLRETAHFTVDGSGAGVGQPEATLVSRSGEPIEVTLQPAGGSLWRATYTPVSLGDHQLRVTWAGRLVKGCPLTVVVSGTAVAAATSGADASRVVCSGSGLASGVVGKEIRSWIDTRRAGPGELTAHCTGPNKVAYCELYEHGDGTFTLNVKPQEAGRHVLNVQFAGQHVPGSPFVLKVAGAPDPSKVRVYGPGVEPGVLATFQSRFLCDTRGAGAGQLTVRVRGPKGAFRVEMQRESQKDRTILCKFSPTEPGDYRVEVRWAGRHVPGSPFPVMIFDTQEELKRYLHSGAS